MQFERVKVQGKLNINLKINHTEYINLKRI